MQQKPILKNFTNLDQQQWAIINRQNQLMLINNYTLQQFVYEMVNINSWQLLQFYKARAQYTMPNTPHIILAANQISNSSLEMFVQTAPFNCDKLIRKSMCDAQIQQLLKNLIKTIQCLVKKFGFFILTDKMIRVTKNHNFLIWVHQNYNSPFREYPLNSKNIYEDYKTMINNILTIFENAGCKKQLQKLKSKIQSQKLLSFQKLKILIQSNLRCQNKTTKQQSIRFYHSPQFLKKRASPINGQRSATTNFTKSQMPSKTSQTRFITSLNLACDTPFKSQSNQSNQSNRQVSYENSSNHEGSIQQKIDQPIQKSSKSMFILFNNHGKFKHKSFTKTGSENQGQLDSKANKEQTTNMKKKDFRQTANSLATTGMASSGKLKISPFDEHTASSSSLVNGDKKVLASSVGDNKKTRDLKQTFKVKISKIIQQNNQQATTPLSFIKSQKSEKQKPKQNNNQNILRQSQLERDFDGLLDSDIETTYRQSSDLLELENQIANILLG